MTFEPKDIARIDNIVTRAQAGGYPPQSPVVQGKAVILAENMARSIKDEDKAERRALAAEYRGYYRLARVFWVRVGQLQAQRAGSW